MRPRILLVLAFCLAFGALAADKPVDVRDLMTATEFHTTGLDKLTPPELAAFNAWLSAYRQAAAPAPVPSAAVVGTPASLPVPPAATPAAAPTPAPSAASTSSFGKEMLSGEQRNEPKRIEAHIVGTFTGWTGSTTFKLDNGQVWQQADSSTYEARLENPAVVIKRLGFGYLLTVTGHGATVFVKRVQ
ncbi:MAG TPA: hypothetical protein VLV87_01630 [Gammaproteobacteria bacterium]|nr:hypothetical protein [Gammaproteobacteria bacterium]